MKRRCKNQFMTNNFSNKRNMSIDFIKGIAIFTVVLGHCWLLDKEIFNFIYAFHMPLFFCISGYLFSTRKQYKDFLVGKFKNLIMPYIVFFIFSYIISITILQRDISIADGLKYMLLGGKHLTYVANWALWYLQLFFIASNIFYFIAKIKYAVIRFIIMAGLLIASLPIQQWCNNTFDNEYVPFALNALCPALFFMLVAFEFKQIKEIFIQKFNNTKTNKMVPVVSFGLFVLGILLAAGNDEQIINIQSYTFFIYSLFILQFIVLSCQNCNNKYIVYMGKNSLIILGLHRTLLVLCSNVLQIKDFFDYFNMTNFAGAFLISCLCIVAICLVNYLVETVAKKLKE